MIFVGFYGIREGGKKANGRKKTKYVKENCLYAYSFYFNNRDGCKCRFICR